MSNARTRAVSCCIMASMTGKRTRGGGRIDMNVTHPSGQRTRTRQPAATPGMLALAESLAHYACMGEAPKPEDLPPAHPYSMARLAIGPANDGPRRVQIEVRAMELAMTGYCAIEDRFYDLDITRMTFFERDGFWQARRADGMYFRLDDRTLARPAPAGSVWDGLRIFEFCAGYLAHQIVEHLKGGF